MRVLDCEDQIKFPLYSTEEGGGRRREEGVGLVLIVMIYELQVFSSIGLQKAEHKIGVQKCTYVISAYTGVYQHASTWLALML